MSTRPPLPPFNAETAARKARAAEDAWNTREPERVALAYTEDSTWRNRAEFINGRGEIVAFLQRKWARELDYREETERAGWHRGGPKLVCAMAILRTWSNKPVISQVVACCGNCPDQRSTTNGQRSP